MRDDAVALVDELHVELRSDKVTKRKAALKQLETHLASADLAKLLDRTTIALDNGLGGEVKHTWAGLAGSLMVAAVGTYGSDPVLAVPISLHAGVGLRGPSLKHEPRGRAA